MLKELHTASLGMLNTQTRLEVTANNIANADTKGYKRASVFERNLIDSKASLFNHPGKLEQDDPPVGSYIDWSTRGGYHNTDNPLDLAIDGSGFFVTRNARGDKFLTRDGSFKLTPDGFIATYDGKYLMGTDDDAIRIPDYMNIDGSDGTTKKTAVDIVVSATGDVLANDVAIGTVQIVDCENYSQLTRIERQSFIADVDAGVKQVAEDMVNIKQGWLENSNVDIITEMVTMIELQRAFEAGSKVIQTNDNTLERSISTSRFGYY